MTLATFVGIWREIRLYVALHNVFNTEIGNFVIHSTWCSFNIERIFNILRPLPRKDRAAIGCTENGQPIRVTVHSALRLDEFS